MKAKDLVNVEPGTFIGVPDAYSILNGKLTSVRSMSGASKNMIIVMNVAGRGEYRTVVGEQCNIRVYGGEPVSAINGEAIQFVNDPDTVKDIVEFVGGVDEFGWEVRQVTSGPRGMFSTYRLGISGNLWCDSIDEGEWLVKRNGRAVKLTDREYQILFGEDD